MRLTTIAGIMGTIERIAAITITITITTTTTTTDMAVIIAMTTSEFRRCSCGAFLIAWVVVAPLPVHAADESAATATSAHMHELGAIVKRDSRAVGLACKGAAQKVAVTAKAVAHAIAAAAKRGVDETRAAIKGGHATRTAAIPAR